MRRRGTKKIGYWRSTGEPELPHPRDSVDSAWDAKERLAVLSYLEEGDVANRWRGSSSCRLCGKRNGSQCLTDGTYTWPSGLAHYVLEHSVRLPQDFVDHVLRSRS